MAQNIRAGSVEQEALRAQLFDAGLLIPSGVEGVYGHSQVFEDLRDRLARIVSDLASRRGAVSLRFPPVLPRRQLEDTGYLANMPHLAGTIFSFEGGDAEASEQAQRAARHEDWSEFQSQSELTLVPAACYPVYPAVARRGPLESGGLVVDTGGAWVFRHEPSTDPARRQIFHMHELVRLGEPEGVLDWREEWAQLGLGLFSDLGLDARLDTANDPFFGRRGRMLAASQRAQDLKLELLVDIVGPEPTACASFNYHLDHFSSRFGLAMADGGPAHTACLGFGHERIVLALLARHGLDPEGWPGTVRDRLGFAA